MHIYEGSGLGVHMKKNVLLLEPEQPINIHKHCKKHWPYKILMRSANDAMIIFLDVNLSQKFLRLRCHDFSALAD